MSSKDQRLVAYCLKQGYLSMEQVKKFLELKAKGDSVIKLIASELGWNKSKVIEILKESQHPEVNKEQKPSETKASVPDGESFGKYILVKKLGSGGMGVVYKAYHPELQSYFAIKTILPGQIEYDIERFKREARVSSQLRHPNIVHVYDVGIEKERHYIVMDYIEGKDLSQVISEEKLGPRKSFKITLKIAEALQYAHEKGVVHRDIKPSNILVSNNEDRTPYLMDFGLASVIQKNTRLTKTNQLLGTPQYMSPEQALGKAYKLDGRSDIYSLGTVLYEMLSKKPVVSGKNSAEIIYKVAYEEAIPPSRCNILISKDAESILLKCLEKEPFRRYQTSGKLAEDIERYLEGEAVFARAPGLIHRLWRKLIRNWKVTVVITGIVLTAVIILSIALASAPNQVEIQTNSIAQEAAELEKKNNLEGATNLYRSILSKFDINHKVAQEGIHRIERIMEDKMQLAEITAEKNLEEGLRISTDILKWYPDHPGALKLYYKLDKKILEDKESRRKNARKYYDRAMEVFWNPRLSEDELIRCKQLFEKAIIEDPSFPDAHFQAGRASHRLFNIEAAMGHYRNSHILDPKLTAAKYYFITLWLSVSIRDVHDIYGKCTLSKDQIKTFMDNLDNEFKNIWGGTFISLETGDPYPILAKISLLWAKLNIIWKEDIENYENIWNDCMRYCNKLIERYPDFSDAYFVRAQLNSYLMIIDKNSSPITKIIPNPKDLCMALNDCEKGIYLDPFRMEGYSLRGAIYRSIGAYELAEKDYTNALLLKRSAKFRFYENRAACYLAMGKYKLALDDFDTFLAQTSGRNVSDRSTREMYSYRAFLRAWGGDKQGAEEDIKRGFSDEHTEGSLIKPTFYLIIDDKIDRAEVYIKNFIKGYEKLFKMLQFMLAAYGPDGPLMGKTIGWLSNFFCAPPNLKRLRERSLSFITFASNKSTEYPIFLDIIDNPDNEFSIASKVYLDFIGKNSDGKDRWNKINLICEKEYPPITLEFIVYTLNYLNEQTRVIKLEALRDLPLSTLYYRRAVEYYNKQRLDNARQDLESALEMDPDFMEAHYGLATLYSLLLSRSNSEKNASYRSKALYHLKRAIETGWSCWEEYTLKDEEFKSLELGQPANQEMLRSWDMKRQENEREVKSFEKDVKELISQGENIQALKLLYFSKPRYISESKFSSQFKYLIDSIENKVMETFAKELEEVKDPSKKIEREQAIDRKIESILGDRGKLKWEGVKRK